jgi:hypothetical protein
LPSAYIRGVLLFSLTTARPGMPLWFKSPAASELGYRSGLSSVTALANDNVAARLLGVGLVDCPAYSAAPTASPKPIIKNVRFKQRFTF